MKAKAFFSSSITARSCQLQGNRLVPISIQDEAEQSSRLLNALISDLIR